MDVGFATHPRCPAISRSVDQSRGGEGRGSSSEQESLPPTITCSALSGSLHPACSGASLLLARTPEAGRAITRGESLCYSRRGKLFGTIHTKNWSSSWTRVLGVMKATQGAAVQRLEDRMCYGQKEAGLQGPLGRPDGAESREEQGPPRKRLTEAIPHGAGAGRLDRGRMFSQALGAGAQVGSRSQQAGRWGRGPHGG